MDKYDDMLDMPHHVSAAHRPMPVADRAVQFAPFSALTGYDSAVCEAGRLTDEKLELSEEEKAAIDEKLRFIRDFPELAGDVSVTYFVRDERKEGGAYAVITGRIADVDEVTGTVKMTGGTKMDINDISALECAAFAGLQADFGYEHFFEN